jgi:hypothetical protein
MQVRGESLFGDLVEAIVLIPEDVPQGRGALGNSLQSLGFRGLQTKSSGGGQELLSEQTKGAAFRL